MEMKKVHDKESSAEVNEEFIFHHDHDDGNDNMIEHITVTNRAEAISYFGSEGKKKLEVVLEKAHKWYYDEQKKNDDSSRYFYDISPENTRKYKRYQLSDDKTFESMFFPEKDSILKLIDKFTNKDEKYAIKGFPHKLGLLVHGSSGTGKTSFIKALAERTGRSIVNVPLARISTNAELSELFFDQKYQVEGGSYPINLRYEDVIFVMENVDAVSDVVKRCDRKNTSVTSMKDELNLIGLLNALDGVVDTPGRIVVMTTTSDPEILDVNLIRPGRIDRKLFLNYMTSSDVVCMVEYLFRKELEEEHAKRLKMAIDGDDKKRALQVTPVQLEQMAFDCDEIEDMLKALEKGF